MTYVYCLFLLLDKIIQIRRVRHRNYSNLHM